MPFPGLIARIPPHHEAAPIDFNRDPRGEQRFAPQDVLRDHSDLLRQRQAAHWARLHHSGLRRYRSLHAAGRAGSDVRHRNRRARAEGGGFGAEGRQIAAAVLQRGFSAVQVRAYDNESTGSVSQSGSSIVLDTDVELLVQNLYVGENGDGGGLPWRPRLVQLSIYFFEQGGFSSTTLFGGSTRKGCKRIQ